MEKRYQVFVSSTFADLQEERARVIQTGAVPDLLIENKAISIT
jgi:hypothetical protein